MRRECGPIKVQARDHVLISFDFAAGVGRNLQQKYISLQFGALVQQTLEREEAFIDAL